MLTMIEKQDHKRFNALVATLECKVTNEHWGRLERWYVTTWPTPVAKRETYRQGGMKQSFVDLEWLNPRKPSKFADLPQVLSAMDPRSAGALCEDADKPTYRKTSAWWQPKSKNLMYHGLGSGAHLSNRELTPSGYSAPVQRVAEEYRSKVTAKGRMPKKDK